MQLKHKAEWATVEEERKQQERLEDRELQRALIQGVTGQGKPASVVESPEEPQVVSANREPLVCESCGKTYIHQKSYRKHIKACK